MASQWRSFKYYSTKISEILCQMCIFKTIKSLNEIFYFLYEKKWLKIGRFFLEETHVTPS